jgi:hypothetical protein
MGEYRQEVCWVMFDMSRDPGFRFLWYASNVHVDLLKSARDENRNKPGY